MSDQPQVSDENLDKPAEASAPTKEDQFVPRKAYEDVSRDMHKYKSGLKDAQAKANELDARLKQIEEEKLRNNEQWQELYEKEKIEKEQLALQHQEDQLRFVQTAKVNALKSELGNVKESYLVHADLKSVSLNDDGTINRDSLHEVANKFREEHSQLIPPSQATTITNQAAPANVNVNQPKGLSDMTLQEKIAAYQKVKLEN